MWITANYLKNEGKVRRAFSLDTLTSVQRICRDTRKMYKNQLWIVPKTRPRLMGVARTQWDLR